MGPSPAYAGSNLKRILSSVIQLNFQFDNLYSHYKNIVHEFIVSSIEIKVIIIKTNKYTTICVMLLVGYVIIKH